MQFSTVTIALASFAGLAVAHPATESFQLQAANALSALEAGGCSVLKCLAAAAPTAVACAAALAEAGANPIADLACFAALANTAVNPPAACNGCL